MADKHGPVLQNKLAERLFQGYFTDGLYPDIPNLMTIVKDYDEINATELQQLLENRNSEQEVIQEARSYTQYVQGVPHFVINNQHALSGAQDPQAFMQIFNKCN